MGARASAQEKQAVNDYHVKKLEQCSWWCLAKRQTLIIIIFFAFAQWTGGREDVAVG